MLIRVGVAFILGLAMFFPAAAQEKTPAIPFLEAWMASPHANVKSESFTHWDKDGKVPVRCAKCHSGPGFVDFLGGDGSAKGKVDRPAPIRSVIDCVTCHNQKTVRLESVMFPSGLTVGNLGSSARCMACHQGRQSTPSVNKKIGKLSPDKVSKKLRFINVHYRAAAATLWGTGAKGGYEYANKRYHGRFRHTPTLSTCTQCHDPHRLTVKAAECASCHAGKEMKAIRFSRIDHDGDGDTKEGIAGEIDTPAPRPGTCHRRLCLKGREKPDHLRRPSPSVLPHRQERQRPRRSRRSHPRQCLQELDAAPHQGGL